MTFQSSLKERVDHLCIEQPALSADDSMPSPAPDTQSQSQSTGDRCASSAGLRSRRFRPPTRRPAAFRHDLANPGACSARDDCTEPPENEHVDPFLDIIGRRRGNFKLV